MSLSFYCFLDIVILINNRHCFFEPIVLCTSVPMNSPSFARNRLYAVEENSQLSGTLDVLSVAPGTMSTAASPKSLSTTPFVRRYLGSRCVTCKCDVKFTIHDLMARIFGFYRTFSHFFTVATKRLGCSLHFYIYRSVNWLII